MKFFDQDNIVITIKSKSDYLELANMVLNFSSTDDKYALEYHCCYVYLLGIKKICGLDVPVYVRKDERPDFIINDHIGLEHTTATTKNYKLISKVIEKYPVEMWHDIPFYAFENMPGGDIVRELEESNGTVTSKTWGEEGQEIIWANCVFDTIRKKLDKITTYREKCPYVELIISDETPAPFAKLEYAMKILKNRYNILTKNQPEMLFGKIHIISGSTLYYDVMSENQRVIYINEL